MTFEDVVFDLLTAWDRFTGGSTLMFHAEGGVPPATVLHLNNTKVLSYVPTLVAEDHSEFAKYIAIPTIRRWGLAYSAFGGHRPLVEPPDGPFAPLPTNLHIRRSVQLPLIPPPIGLTSHTVFYGRPDEELKDMIAKEKNKYRKQLDIYRDRAVGPASICSRHRPAVATSPSPNDATNPVLPPPHDEGAPAEPAVSDSEATLSGYPEHLNCEMTYLEEIRCLKEQVEDLERQNGILHAELESVNEERDILKLHLTITIGTTELPPSSATPANSLHTTIPTSPANSSHAAVSMLPTISSVSSISQSTQTILHMLPDPYGDDMPRHLQVPYTQLVLPPPDHHQPLVPFGEHSTEALCYWGLPTIWHRELWEIEHRVEPDDSMPSEVTYGPQAAIAARPIQPTKRKHMNQDAATTRERHAAAQAKHDEIERELAGWYASAEDTAKQLATRFDKEPQYFLSRMFSGGFKKQKERKPNVWNAWQHRVMTQANEDREPGERQGLIETIEECRDAYDRLSDSAKQDLLEELLEERDSRKIGVRLNQRGRIADVNAVWALVIELLKGLKARVGIEFVLLLVRNNHEFLMDPKWFISSMQIDEYLHVAVHGWDPEKIGTLVEAFLVAGCDFMSFYCTPREKAEHLRKLIRRKILEGLGALVESFA
ncbi:hypothetical protein DAEQUDRAFT_766380 [Daedalea quercina L-15889]|uniref:Uncharacterized protein n=1 Tax=Daedalea quercina L-15889 TaxID=1314783 RepID=A0A165PM21_9APHY|nr:hypothetical protein DAEQUDRAFT_766380 [Daedalea quercina L-15889]